MNGNFLNNPDPRAVLQGTENIFIDDDFNGVGTTATIIGSLGWGAGGLNGGGLMGSEERHPGIYQAQTGATGALFLNYKDNAAGPDGYNGLTVQGVFRLPSITNGRWTFGVGQVNGYQVAGYRGVTFDPANSPNWRLHHRTSGGSDVFTDTGKAAVAGNWVRVKLTYELGVTTCCIATTASPIEAIVTNSGAYTVGATPSHCPQWVWQSTSGNKTIDVDHFRMTGFSSRL